MTLSTVILTTENRTILLSSALITNVNDTSPVFSAIIKMPAVVSNGTTEQIICNFAFKEF